MIHAPYAGAPTGLAALSGARRGSTSLLANLGAEIAKDPALRPPCRSSLGREEMELQKQLYSANHPQQLPGHSGRRRS